MPQTKRLIVGLGNPGAEYEGTRHNVGFAVAEALAEKAGFSFERDAGHALLGWGRYRGCSFGVARPLTYMNRSGTAVQGLLRRHGLAASEILVVVDDINLELGQLRVRERGGAGGHNGLQDIIERLGTDAFPRLRIGIGSAFRRGQQVDYVLSPFSKAERPVIEAAVERACEAAITFACKGVTQAMNRFN